MVYDGRMVRGQEAKHYSVGSVGRSCTERAASGGGYKMCG